MENEFHEGVCETKVKFKSLDYAKRRMHQPWQDFEEGERVYKCPVCHFWHIGQVDMLLKQKTQRDKDWRDQQKSEDLE